MNNSNKLFMTIEEALRQTWRDPAPESRRISLSHIINPFLAPAGSEHDIAQNITFASMRAAKAAAAVDPELTVDLISVQYPEDRPVVPEDFVLATDLERSINDVVDFEAKRKLPLLWDLLMTGADAATGADDDDFLIFTNTDIGLNTHFYTFVAEVLRRGLDALVINRRTIPGYYDSPGQLPLMYGEVGRCHVGFDCYILRRRLLRDFEPFETCVGIGKVTQPLMHNMIAATTRMAVLLDAHVTFHVGNDQTWKSEAFNGYSRHNRAEVVRVFEALSARPGIRDRLIERLINHTEYFVLDDDIRKAFGIPRTGWLKYRIRQRLRRHLDWGQER